MEATVREWSDAELLASVWGGAPAAAAKALLSWGGLAGVTRACVRGFEAQGRELSDARRRKLCAAFEVVRRVGQVPAPQGSLEHADDVAAFLAPRFACLAVEELHALYLDDRRAPIRCERLTSGSDRYTVVDPRQVYRRALAAGAAYLVLAHNHPSGDPTPSAQDREVTRRVAEAGRVVGVELLAHIVFAGSRWAVVPEHAGSSSRVKVAAWCWTS